MARWQQIAEQCVCVDYHSLTAHQEAAGVVLQMCLGALLQLKRTMSRLGLGSAATVSKSTLVPYSLRPVLP